jgi:hypothetical protein
MKNGTELADGFNITFRTLKYWFHT